MQLLGSGSSLFPEEAVARAASELHQALKLHDGELEIEDRYYAQQLRSMGLEGLINIEVEAPEIASPPTGPAIDVSAQLRLILEGLDDENFCLQQPATAQ